MRRCLKNKVLWALIFWPETIESSVISVKDITEAVKPELIKIGWKGDLPWVDENGITTLYEATIIKISHHRSYLLSIDIDCFGKIIKETQPENIMKEKNSITKLKKESTKLKSKQKAKVQQSLINITEIGKMSKTQKQKPHNDDVVKNRVTDDKNSPKNNQLEDYSDEDNNFSNKILLEGPKEHMQCSNCTDCFCKSWRKLITPQVVTVFEKMVQSMNKLLLKDPEYGNFLSSQLKKVIDQEIDLQEEEKADKSEEEDDIQLQHEAENHISLNEAHEQQEPPKKPQQGDEHHIPQRINQQQPELSKNIQQNSHSQELIQQQPQQPQNFHQNSPDQFSQYPYYPQQFYYQPPPHYPPINYHQQSQHQPIPYPQQNPAWPSNCPPPSYAHQQFPPSYTYDNNFQQNPINNVTQPDLNLQPL